MKKQLSVKGARALAIIAIVLTLPTSLMALVSGVFMMVSNIFTLAGGIICFAVAFLLFVDFIVGLVSLAKPQCALISAIMSVISAIALICCAAIPFQYGYMYAMSITAGLLCFAEFAMYSIYCVKSPQKLLYDEQTLKYKADVLLIKMNSNAKKFEDGQISLEEFTAIDQDLSAQRNQCLDLVRNPRHKLYTKKQKILIFTIPLLVAFLIFCISIPSTVVGTLDFAYEIIEEHMGNVSEIDYFCGGTHSNMTLVYRMPDSYRDVRIIKKHYSEVKSQIAKLYESESGAEYRQNYLALYSIKEQDDRWCFDSFIRDYKLLSDAKWTDGENFINFGELNYDLDGWHMDCTTNLPKNIPPEYDESQLSTYLIYRDNYIEYGHSPKKDNDTNYIYGGVSSNFLLPMLRICDIDVSENGVFTIRIYVVGNEKQYDFTLDSEEVA